MLGLRGRRHGRRARGPAPGGRRAPLDRLRQRAARPEPGPRPAPAGALQALAEAGLGPEALRELPTERLDVAAGRDAGARLLGLADRPPPSSAPTTCSPSVCSRRCTRRASPSPDDLAIVGYDDIEFAAAAVPLTSVRQPAVTMGALAAELLL